MERLSPLWKFATRWYVSLPFVVAVGVVVGYFVFFDVYPGKPKVGVIDIPFTVITEDSAFTIGAFLDYARRNDDIKAVVIRLSSPGGDASPSEHLFIETRKLREKKPVVIVMNDLVASGAYMMSLGANFTYAKPSTFVGSVGVVLTFPGPLIPTLPDERVITTGPFKRGSDRRYFIEIADQLKESFAQMVVTERGDKLRIASQELAQGRIYTGIEGVRLGLVDDIGGEADAFEKAADLAGISDYDVLDVNVEVLRAFNEEFWRIVEPVQPLFEAATLPDLGALVAPSGASGDPAQPALGGAWITALRRQFLTRGVEEIRQDWPEGLPLEIDKPRIYYLYVGPSP